MKTPEEIEKLAEKAILLTDENIEYIEFAQHDRKQWANGYTQCQSDIQEGINNCLGTIEFFRKENAELRKWLNHVLAMYSDADSILPNELTELLNKYK